MAYKTFDHAVIYDGKFYPANTPVKVKDVKPATKKAVKRNDGATNKGPQNGDSAD